MTFPESIWGAGDRHVVELPAGTDIWSLWAHGFWALVPTNTCRKADGSAVMGAGLAKEAAIKFPGLALRYGAALKRDSTRIVVPGCRLLLGPTKDDWRRPARKDLVVELLSAVAGWCDAHQSAAIAVPAIGCGNGGMQYRELRELALQRLARCRAVVLPPKAWPAGRLVASSVDDARIVELVRSGIARELGPSGVFSLRT